MAFEFEKKFILTDEQKEKLLEDAEFLGEKIFTDTYFDNADFSLALSDMWLKKRDDEFNLKIPMRQKEGETINKYHEVDGEMAIREVFAIPKVLDFEKDLQSFGHKPFCVLKTTRKKFFKNGFTIDLDESDFGDWKYRLVEIRLVVNRKDEMNEAEEKIYDFARKHGLETKHIDGKLSEFIKRELPELYEKIKEEKNAY